MFHTLWQITYYPAWADCEEKFQVFAFTETNKHHPSCMLVECDMDIMQLMGGEPYPHPFI